MTARARSPTAGPLGGAGSRSGGAAREALGCGLVTALLDATTRSLHRIAVDRQREGRVPGLYAAVCRGGEQLWGEGVGRADLASGGPPGPDDQFLIASNTKTFVA